MVFILSFIGCKANEQGNLVNSEYFSLSLSSDWKIFRTDIEQQILGMHFFETATGLSGELDTNISLRIRYITTIVDENTSSILDYWIDTHTDNNGSKSKTLQIKNFKVFEHDKIVSVRDEEVGKVIDYYETLWCLVGDKNTYFVRYGSFSLDSYQKEKTSVIEMLSSFKEAK